MGRWVERGKRRERRECVKVSTFLILVENEFVFVQLCDGGLHGTPLQMCNRSNQLRGHQLEHKKWRIKEKFKKKKEKNQK